MVSSHNWMCAERIAFGCLVKLGFAPEGFHNSFGQSGSFDIDRILLTSLTSSTSLISLTSPASVTPLTSLILSTLSISLTLCTLLTLLTSLTCLPYFLRLLCLLQCFECMCGDMSYFALLLGLCAAPGNLHIVFDQGRRLVRA